MKKIFWLFFLLPCFTYAQTDESDTLKLKASLSITGFWQAGNVQTVIFRTIADVNYKPSDKWAFRTKNSYVYQAFGGDKADEDILSLNFLSFNHTKKFHPQVLGFVSTNFRREIDLRYLIGAGITYQILQKQKSWLKFSVSGEYEETDYTQENFNISEYDGSPSINTLRSTFWFNGKHYILKDKVIFTHESYFQASLEQSNNFRWRTDLALELPIWKFLNFKINYLHTFENIVIDGQEQADQFLTVGFKVKNHE